MRLLFDVETDGLLATATKLYCIVAIDIDTDEEHVFTPCDLGKGIALLESADVLLGHNIIGFDGPVIDKLTGINVIDPERCCDTLILSKLIYPNLKELDFSLEPSKQRLPAQFFGRHSLEAWGLRLGCHKMEKPDFTSFSPEMLEYCRQDVRLNVRLYRALMKKAKYDTTNTVHLENQIAFICTQQELDGTPFDSIGAQQLHQRLSARKEELKFELQSAFEPTVVEMKTKTKVIPFNPGSRQQIADRLMARGWTPKQKTETGQAMIDEDVLNDLGKTLPEAQMLSEYFLIDKRLGMVDGWIKACDTKGRIHGRVDTLGTGTHRCSHSSPNLAQVPSVAAPYGKECRGLFRAPEGMVQVGCDVSRLELVMLAHYLNDSKFTEALLEGDIHTTLAEVYGTPRGPGKNVTYAMIYGAGDEKLGVTADSSLLTKAKRVAKGREIRENIKQRLPALDRLTNQVKGAAKLNHGINLIDGRFLPIRSEHSALNFLLQGSGAVVCKTWVVLFHKNLQKAGLYDSVQQVAFVHDEVQLHVCEGLEEQVGNLCVQSIEEAGKALGVRLPLTGEFKTGRSWAECH